VYYYLRFRGMSKRGAEERTIKWLKEMDLWDYRNKPIRYFIGWVEEKSSRINGSRY